MRFKSILVGLLLTLTPYAALRAQGTAAATAGWYNGDWKQGIPGYANWYLSNTSFSRTYDDFVVPAGGWTISGVFSNNSIYSSTPVTEASWEIRSGMSAGNGGTVLASGLGAAIQTLVGPIGDGGYNYRIEVDKLNVTLGQGTYWLSVTPVIGHIESYVCATLGANAIGNPQGNDGKAFFFSTVAANSNFAAAQSTGQGGTSGDFSLGVLVSAPTQPSLGTTLVTGWYNGDWQPGIPSIANWYFSDKEFARVYDDFVVPAGGWTIVGVSARTHIYSQETVTQASWEIRSGMSVGNGGAVVASGLGQVSQTLIATLGDSGKSYVTEVDGLQVSLPPGSYWLSVAPVIGSMQSYETYLAPTLGANAIGNPPGNDGNAFFYSTVIANANFSTARPTGGGGTSGDFSLGVLIPAPTPPSITAVVNAASFHSGPVSPGEIVTIAGSAIGPPSAASLTLDQSGNVATSIGGVQVLFGGFAAPLTYVSAAQINAVVPYQVAGLTNTSVQVDFGGQASNTFPLILAASAPALFTFNGSGTGPAAILNQDNSYNTPANPAAKGSYVALFITGEGQTSPGGVTGKVTTASPAPPLTPEPVLPVSVSIGGQPATIAFCGEAPGVVSGVMQLNVQIPPNAPSGNLPISVSVGANSSQDGATVAVQ